MVAQILDQLLGDLWIGDLVILSRMRFLPMPHSHFIVMHRHRASFRIADIHHRQIAECKPYVEPSGGAFVSCVSPVATASFFPVSGGVKPTMHALRTEIASSHQSAIGLLAR